MISNGIKERGLLAKLLEQGIRILLLKECKKINNLKINIISSSTHIIKGEIQKISISAEDINYKYLLFDKFELEADHLKVNFSFTTRELHFRTNPIIKFKISLSENSLRTVLLSTNWNWIGAIISKEIFNEEKLKDLKIINEQLSIITFKKNVDLNQWKQINIKTKKGKIYLENNFNNKFVQIPIEDKIYVENVYIENNLMNIFAYSTINL